MVRRPVAAGRGVWWGGAGEGTLLEREVGVQVDLGGVGLLRGLFWSPELCFMALIWGFDVAHNCA